jgi:tripartite-type tricarboxylate transporter receptor subunit TctC
MKNQPKFVALAVCALLAPVLLVCPQVVRAEYPDRPITIYISHSPGGSVDMIIRTIAPVASKILGQPFVLENKAGAGGSIALALVANAKPDGYTLCSGTHGGLVRVPQVQKLPYKVFKSFTPIIAYAQPLNTIVVKPEAPWKSLKELVDYAKRNPNKIKYSTGGVGGGMHSAMLVIEYQENIKWIHVPYKGTTDAMTALLGGHVDVCSAGPDVYPMERAGQLRILAIAESSRHPGYPNIPTMKEVGYYFSNDTFYNIMAPAGLPPDVSAKLEKAFVKASESKEFKAVVDKLDMLQVLHVGKAYGEIIKNTWFETEKSLKQTGLIKEPATSPN